MSQRILAVATAVFLLGCGAAGVAGAAQPVDLELVLAVDVSSSIDAEEAQLQLNGYVAALGHPEVIRAIEGGLLGRIALMYYEWAGDEHLNVIAPWTLIDGAESMRRFAQKIAAAPVHTAPRTSIANAIEFALPQFRGNAYEGTRQVIDISGDGPNNGRTEILEARGKAIADGVTINGLPIVNGRGDPEVYLPLPNVDLYYRDCVIGGPGAFLVVANSFKEFGLAIRRKLITEIAGMPPAPAMAAVDGGRPGPRLVLAAGLPSTCDFGPMTWQNLRVN
jgi:hypothetical protein